MRNFAAIDCGTNSIRLLIAQEDGTELNRDNIIVRLGQGVDATGRFAPKALKRVEDALQIYSARMREHDVVDVMMGATSATRDASNRDEFFAMTRAYLGKEAVVISGEREARLSFRGAVMDLSDAQLETTCVIDLGGGSTEFVVGGAEAYSADMGCVRLTERFGEDKAAAREYVAQLLGEVQQHVDLSRVTNVVGVAGTMTTLCAIAQGLDSYQPEKIHMHTLPLARMRETALKVGELSPAQRMELGPMHPGRADVIGGGALIVEAFTTLFEKQGLKEMTISEKDILDGILAEVIDRN